MKITRWAAAGLAAVLLAGMSITAHAQSYTVASIGPSGSTFSLPYAVNDHGQAVGKSYLTTPNGWAFIFTAATGLQLLPALAGSSWSEADDINHNGQVVGFCVSATASTGFLWDSTNGTRQIDQIADSKGVTAARLGWTIWRGRAINSIGDILCWGTRSGVRSLGIWHMATDLFGATALTVTLVPNHSEWNYFDLNDNGVVLTDVWNQAASAYVFGLWDSNSGAFSTFLAPSFTRGYALNNHGVAVSFDGLIYSPDNGITQLGSLGAGAAYTTAYDVNDISQVVGYSGAKHSSTPIAFLWQNGVMKDLRTLSNADTRWQFHNASSASNPSNASGTAGYIVGWGSYKNQNVGWILTPK